MSSYIINEVKKGQKVPWNRGFVVEIIHRFQYILNLVYQILMKLWENVLGMKRMKTDEFVHMLTHSCLGMPIILTQIGLYLVPKYTVFNISRIWFIRFWWNFKGMFLVWKEDWWVWSHVLTHSCLGMPIILAQIGLYLVPKYTVFNISWIWFIRFWWNFERMFLVWKEWRLMSLVTW